MGGALVALLSTEAAGKIESFILYYTHPICCLESLFEVYAGVS